MRTQPEAKPAQSSFNSNNTPGEKLGRILEQIEENGRFYGMKIACFVALGGACLGGYVAHIVAGPMAWNLGLFTVPMGTALGFAAGWLAVLIIGVVCAGVAAAIVYGVNAVKNCINKKENELNKNNDNNGDLESTGCNNAFFINSDNDSFKATADREDPDPDHRALVRLGV